MSASYQIQKKCREDLQRIWDRPDQVSVIHYSCESFYGRRASKSPRITSIAVRNLKTGQTKSFSIHKYGELKGIAISKLSQNFDKLETEMLKQFFKFVKEKREYKWVHWNMRNENYGFHAIEHRLRVLGGKPFVIPEDKKFDLSKILSGIYGDGYIDDPKLEKLMEKNEISKLNFKTGKEEATLFKKRSYVALHQSTLAKVDLISDLWQLAYMEKLKQKNGWRKVHGSSFSAFVDWLWAKPIFRFAMIILAILGILTYANSFLRFLLTQIL